MTVTHAKVMTQPVTIPDVPVPGLNDDLSPEERFTRASQLYSSGNYEEALEIWKNLRQTGYRSAELDYNIGNAYFKLNNIAAAILFWERARLLKPGDDDIRYNLQIANTLVVDKFEEIPELFFIEWYNFLALIASSNLWAGISVVSFLGFLLFLSLYLYSSKYKLKVAGFWIAVVLFFISVSSLALSARNKRLVYDSRQAVIFAPAINGKSSPDDSGTDLFLLHEGTKVFVEDKVGEWYEIRLSDGNKGWIPASAMEII
ncbi:MAG: hypothetical protein JXR66_12520 [Bacteroidales bacterium]|nr:hypothetical protein [Bacteroidales bacterium]MBN2634377.1 hypothetical protein [Bacteroidales bacterium]